MAAAVAGAKLGCDACQLGLCFICERESYFFTLEEDLRSLKDERRYLTEMANHIRPHQRASYNTHAWLRRVDALDTDHHVGIVIQEAEEEIMFKCHTFFCPKNVWNCSAVGRKVTRKLEYVKELSKEGREYAAAVDAIPQTVSLNLSAGREVAVEGLRQTDVGAANIRAVPA